MATATRTVSAARGRSLVWRARRLLPLLVLLLLGAVSWQTGLLRHIDLRSQQLALHLLSPAVPESRQLLVISPESNHSDSNTYASVLKRVAELGPRTLFVTADPPAETRSTLAALRKDGNIFVGLRIVRNSFGDGKPRPATRHDGTYPTVVLGHTRDVLGLHEGQYATFEHDGTRLDTPVSILARQENRPVADFGIDFANAKTRIPQISWKRVLDGGLIEELVEDRVVIIADSSYLESASVSTLAGANTPQLLTDALAVDTWLESRQATTLPAPLLLALLCVILLVGLFVFQWLSYQRSIWTTIWSSLLFGIGSPLALVYLNFDIPGSVMIMAVTFAALTVLYSKLQTEDEEFRRVLLSASLTLQQQQKSTDNRRSEDPWGECHQLVSQILAGQRFALLSIDARGRKIDSIKLHQIEQSEISEKRRDVRRSPFADASAQRRPIDITASESWRPFFEPIENERQLICALQVAGENLGYLVAGISDEFAREHPDYEDLVRSITVRAADLVRTSLEPTSVVTSPLDYLQLRGGRLLSRTVARMGEAVGTRLDDMENLFDQLGTATVVYDLFGSVIYSNKQMSKLVESTELKPYELRAAEFLAGLTRLSIDEAKTRIRDAIVAEELTQLAVTVDLGTPGTSYYVNVRSIRDSNDGTGALSGSLDTAGILFEIVDLAGTQRVGKSRQVLTKHLDYELRTRLGSLMMATAMLKDDAIAKEHRQLLIGQLTENIDQATALLDESQDLLHSDPQIESAEKAADPADIIEEVVAHVQSEFAEANVELRIEKPSLAFLVRGDIDALIESLVLILRILVRDTAEEGVVNLFARQQAGQFVFVTRNEGFGIPVEQLQAYLSGKDQSASKEFRDLRTALQHVQTHGTRVQANSSVAKGMVFKLTVPRVMSNDTDNESN